MTLALIQPVEMSIERLWVPLVHCGPCGQQMPADHRDHINSEAASDATETAREHRMEHS